MKSDVVNKKEKTNERVKIANSEYMRISKLEGTRDARDENISK